MVLFNGIFVPHFKYFYGNGFIKSLSMQNIGCIFIKCFLKGWKLIFFCKKTIPDILAFFSILISIKNDYLIEKISKKSEKNWNSPISWLIVSTEYIVNRGILSHISNMNIQFWAVLGSQGCREQQDRKEFQPHRLHNRWQIFESFAQTAQTN